MANCNSTSCVKQFNEQAQVLGNEFWVSLASHRNLKRAQLDSFEEHLKLSVEEKLLVKLVLSLSSYHSKTNEFQFQSKACFI